MEFKLGNSYTYKVEGTYATSLIDTFTVTANGSTVVAYTYTYDNNGNITRITTSNGYEYRYVYDDLGQLIREDNSDDEKTYLYTYDNAGNILTKQICAYTAAGVTPTPTTTYTYTYGNSNWGDQLTAYRGQAITYDNIGNPLTYYNGNSYEFTWTQGRRLASAVVGSYNLAYNYNADGIRTSKTVNGVEYRYTLDGTKILTQEWGNEMLVFLYDEAGSPVGFQYRNSTYAYDQFDTYWYRKNLQGDIVAIYDAYGTQLVSYRYDAWGNVVISYQNGGVLTNARFNPFTYRGYYYDSETGFYYLNSRYYDPATCRFINADNLVSTGQDILGYNMYSYCGNNPVMRVDKTGQAWWVFASAIVGAVVGATAQIASNILTGQTWHDGVVGAAVGGATYGAVLASTGNVAAAGFASAAAESLTNEIVSYVPRIAQINGEETTKELTWENVGKSLGTVAKDTLINGTVNSITGKIAGKIVPTNNGWFKPQKFVSSFIGKYARKSALQTVAQACVYIAYQVQKYIFEESSKHPVLPAFP